nr:MAG TPA: hypothetical protein [Caudoviricetes sp.]
MTLAFDDDILWLFVAENMPPLWNNICRSVVSVRSRNATLRVWHYPYRGRSVMWI